MTEDVKEFLLAFEERITTRFDERFGKFRVEMEEMVDNKFEKFRVEMEEMVDNKLEKFRVEMEEMIDRRIENLVYEISDEIRSTADFLHTSAKSNFTKTQENIKNVNNKILIQSKILSKGYKQMANNIDSKVAM